ncbi:MAG: SCO family protein [Myxococcota bacterium]
MKRFVMTVLLFLVAACSGQGANQYIVEGVVVEVKGDEVVLDHEDIEGLMPAMVMGFKVDDPAMLEPLEPGHKVIARYTAEGPASRLDKIRITGKGPAPKVETAPVRRGEVWEGVDVPVHDGTTMRLGSGQQGRVLLTFIYTRCPIPEACPAIVNRFLAMQQRIGEAEGVKLLAITLDPSYDTLDRLAKFATDIGASDVWKLGRVEPEVLAELAKRAGMNVMPDGDEIAHGLRILVLDTDGKLLERYDAPDFDGDRVFAQLTTGAEPEVAPAP